MQNRKSGTGFTLIEILVVVAIIALLAGIVMSSIASARERGRDARRISDVHQIYLALELYASDHNGTYPIMGTPSTLDNLTAQYSITPKYIPSIPVAPTPAAPNCTTSQNSYLYQSVDGVSYILQLCLGSKLGSAPAGLNQITNTSGGAPIAFSGSFANDPNACYKNAPTITGVTSLNQSAGAGTNATYTIKIKNNDTATCSSSSFTATGNSLPAGFTASQFTNINLAPGATSGNITITVSIPSNASPNSYPFYIIANSSGGPVGSAGATVTVTPGCIRDYPDVTINPSTGYSGRNQTIPYTFTVTNKDNAACSSTNFTAQLFSSGNSGITGSSSSYVIAPGQSHDYIINVTTANTVSNGMYNMTGGATDGNSFHMSSSPFYHVVQ